MDVWTMIFANLVANNMKTLDEVPAELKADVEKALKQNNEPV